ncbi:MAG: lipopolysaccharide heptosyltransferase II [Chloroflexi bacterium]|nr:lipopolysaccharide heptosyltransferase II [Chloroflexota bacterium]
MKDRLVEGICRILAAPYPKANPARLRDPKAIAILKPCCLGDVLMATPTLASLRSAFPDARIAFVVGSWSRAVISGNPKVDEVIDCGRVGAGRGYSLAEYLSLVRCLRQGKFDACFVLERSLWLTLVPYLAGIPARIGLDSEGRGFSLNVRVPCKEIKHEAELYLDTVRAIGVVPGEPRLEYFVDEEDRASTAALLGEKNAAGPLVVIHPGGGANPGMLLTAKRWPARRFAAVADRLAEEFGARIVLAGSNEDAEVVANVKSGMRSAYLDLHGRLTLGQLAAIVEKADLFIGNDTGPMHLAVAVSAPVVAIFGPSDARMYGPYSNTAAVVFSDVPCRPCFTRGAYPECSEHVCTERIEVDQVWRAARDLLSRSRRTDDSASVARNVATYAS